MSNQTPKDVQKGGQGAIGKQPQQADTGSREQLPNAAKEKQVHYKDQRPGQKP